MAKYESPCQIATLFIGALVVSACVIFLLQLEAKKRYGEVKDHQDEPRLDL